MASIITRFIHQYPVFTDKAIAATATKNTASAACSSRRRAYLYESSVGLSLVLHEEQATLPESGLSNRVSGTLAPHRGHFISAPPSISCLTPKLSGAPRHDHRHFIHGASAQTKVRHSLQVPSPLALLDHRSTLHQPILQLGLIGRRPQALHLEPGRGHIKAISRRGDQRYQ
jgi:hypothetical protein